MSKNSHDDLDERGISPRDVIDGPWLRMLSFNLKNRRVVKFEDYMAGEYDKHVRRMLGWVLPDRDGNPPPPAAIQALMDRQRAQQRREHNIKRAAEERAKAVERRRIKQEKKKAKKAALESQPA